MTEVSERDRDMILTPTNWPMFYLPLKRRVEGESWPQIALLRSASTDPDAIRIVEKGMSMYGPMGEVETLTYPTVDALLADGWVVD